MQEKSSVLDVLSGNESVKFDVSISFITLVELFAAIMLCSMLILLMKKAIL